MPDLAIIFRYRRANTYGQHAILAALETEPPGRSYRVQIASTVDDLVAQIAQARADAGTVLVAWSFYSPNVAAAIAELTVTRHAAESPAREAPARETPDREAPGQAASDRAAPYREAPGRVLHIAGGVHATAEPLATLRAGFDLVALGDGEATFTALAAALAEGRGYDTVPGLAFLDSAGQMVKTQPAARYELDRYRVSLDAQIHQPDRDHPGLHLRVQLLPDALHVQGTLPAPFSG